MARPLPTDPRQEPAPDQWPVQNVCLVGPVPREMDRTATPVCTTLVPPSSVAPWGAVCPAVSVRSTPAHPSAVWSRKHRGLHVGLMQGPLRLLLQVLLRRLQRLPEQGLLGG
jgi:hypothetical protein